MEARHEPDDATRAAGAQSRGGRAPVWRGRIFPYGAPTPIARDLWQIRGALAVPGVPRNMTVYRARDGRLVLYSVLAMHEDGMRALEALGEPAWMVMPHDRHQMDAAFYLARYPDLRVVAPEPAHARSVPVDAGLDELEAIGIRGYLLPGTSYHEAILELPVEGGVAVCSCELLGDARAAEGVLLRAAMRVLGPPGGGFGVARAVRWREVTDRGAVRQWLESLAARSDVRAVLIAHGPPLVADVQAELGRAARRL